jgi:hypothetical protein
MKNVTFRNVTARGVLGGVIGVRGEFASVGMLVFMYEVDVYI